MIAARCDGVRCDGRLEVDPYCSLHGDIGRQNYRDREALHYARRMLQALDAYWLTIDGLPKGRYPRGRYDAEDWWGHFEKYRAKVEAQL